YSRLDVGRGVHHDVDVADRQAVREAIRSLPDRQRTALILRYYLDLPAPEVADRMGTTHGAVRALTKRAVAALREQLGPDAITIELEEPSDVA
ncbi:MAG TPA: sigma-70 family RNA polymerase sigma factor, partial [Nitriliruptorales bacterium]